MAFTPTAGKNAVAKLTLGGNSEVTAPGINWKFDGDAKLFDVSNFRDGREVAPTLDDATISLTLIWDGGEQPTKATSSDIRLGVRGTVKCYTDATHFFGVTGVVSTLSPHNDGVESVVMLDVTFRLSGSITYPVDP